MTTRTKVLIATGILAVLILALLFSRSGAMAVDTAAVRRDTLQVSVTAEGRTRLHDRFTVAAPVSGRLQRIGLREGQVVSKGDIVARIAPAPEDPRTQATARARVAVAEARRQEAAAQLSRLEGQAEQARREATRRRTLAEAGAVSTELLEQAEQAAATAGQLVDAARSTLTAADADVVAARSALIGADAGSGASGAAIVVRAPAGGRVLRVLEPSERVVPVGTPLLEVGEVKSLEVVVDVLSRDAAQINVGDPIYLTEWGGDQVLLGTVRVVGPDARTKISALGVEEQRVDVVGDLNDPPPSLGVGFRVEARIATWTGTDVLVVPTSALFPDGNEWQVFRVEDGRARRRTVELGRRNDAAAEVRGGLEAGDQVILFPSDLVSDGVRVSPRRPPR